jgi:hypothetical protein
MDPFWEPNGSLASGAGRRFGLQTAPIGSGSASVAAHQRPRQPGERCTCTALIGSYQDHAVASDAAMAADCRRRTTERLVTLRVLSHDSNIRP